MSDAVKAVRKLIRDAGKPKATKKSKAASVKALAALSPDERAAFLVADVKKADTSALRFADSGEPMSAEDVERLVKAAHAKLTPAEDEAEPAEG